MDKNTEYQYIILFFCPCIEFLAQISHVSFERDVDKKNFFSAVLRGETLNYKKAQNGC